ncbi:hypothetical protein QBZ16_003533 [Prototheca wickerhamii]|uniref:Uncharacterized protein n=1 Tax=Prototheca wickerhamii TaxID=3111 RepID=A0AAD9MLU4_PROWI|nr:hypothetical protein QBZ16_003533 [Prototheca wickerhamii]
MAEQIATAALIPSTGAYSLGAKCASEAIGTCLVGNRMGWGFVAFGFGMSFGVIITMFNYISAHLNPASCLALLVLGDIDGKTFVCLALSEFAGAFGGAILVWLHFLPHFKTIPEPPSKSDDELLLRSRDAISPEALSIASYNTRGEDQRRRRRPAKVILSGAVKDVQYFLSNTKAHPEDHDELLKVAFGGPTGLYERSPTLAEEAVDPTVPRGPLRRRSVQVADVHRRIKDMELAEFQQMLRVPQVGAGRPLPPSKYHNEVSLEVPPPEPKRSHAPAGALPDETKVSRSKPSIIEHTLRFLDHPPEPRAPGKGAAPKTAHEVEDDLTPAERLLEARRARADALFQAAIVADQNAKLSIFATRPAIWSPFFNALCEFMCTIALILLYLLLVFRGNQLYEPARGLWRATVGLWAGFLIFLLGSSEFYYGWIPVLADFAGGAIAALLFKAIQKLNHSDVPGATVMGPIA